MAMPNSDVDELAKFGYKQELDRSLGLFSSFAAGFSYISIMTGVFELFFFGFGSGGPAFIWTWPAVFVGQFLVALCFAELAGQYPLAGSVYQWSKQIAKPFTSWFGGWILTVGSVVTLSGLAIIVLTRPAEGARPGPTRLGLAAATTAAAAWAGSLLVLKPAMGALDPVTAQAVRLPLAGFLLLATPWGWETPSQLARVNRGVLARIALLGAVTAMSSVLFVSGVKLADVAVAAVLSSTAPLFAIPLGLIFLGERLTARAALGTLVTVSGLAVLQL